ncbi:MULTISPECIES: hypothetical protein [unclassified Shewanella]|uniref:hypothetical protein n=1 Tax=unclassified Shewanella TaxID=196818 RepID=UPI0021DB220E|nr:MULTISPECIES: hypothetical protein [unclassified Shewanella]MCU8035034.1 hypothetical protein [Shewanella sp. SM71]MCU8096904.1 hypothetical protein [Shewanella sp. SM102]
MAFVTHNSRKCKVRSGVNSMPIANAQPKRIQNRVYRQCAKDGFNARIKAELAGDVPATVPLYSHSLTRQSYFEQGWHAVTHLHVLKARDQRKAQAMAVPNEQ